MLGRTPSCGLGDDAKREDASDDWATKERNPEFVDEDEKHQEGTRAAKDLSRCKSKDTHGAEPSAPEEDASEHR